MSNRTKDATINLRASPSQLDMIGRAAALISKSRSDFILEASCEKAVEVLLDQHVIIVTNGQFADFEKAFSQPLPENKKFQNLMSDKYKW